MIKYLKGVNVPGQNNPPLTVKAYIPNEAGDGKDVCDVMAALINSHVRRVINSGFSIICSMV